MSMIGYTQLMKDIFDVDRASTEALLSRLATHKPSELRMAVLKSLARAGEETISQALKIAGQNNTGGTYKTILSFFRGLAKENILSSERRGQREYWRFSDSSKDLQKYLLNAS